MVSFLTLRIATSDTMVISAEPVQINIRLSVSTAVTTPRRERYYQLLTVDLTQADPQLIFPEKSSSDHRTSCIEQNGYDTILVILTL